MLILVRNAKGNKDRYTLLSKTALKNFRKYYKQWRPSEYLFESPSKEKYSPNSVDKIITNAALKTGIKKTYLLTRLDIVSLLISIRKWN